MKYKILFITSVFLLLVSSFPASSLAATSSSQHSFWDFLTPIIQFFTPKNTTTHIITSSQSNTSSNFNLIAGRGISLVKDTLNKTIMINNTFPTPTESTNTSFYVYGGSGVTVKDSTISLQLAGNTKTSTTISGSGLEISNGALSLLQGCNDGQLLKWDSSKKAWNCQGDNNSGLSGTVGISNGGTGATSASDARSNLSAAASGSNGDITALTGLTTALSSQEGGTGANLSGATTGSVPYFSSVGVETALSVGTNGQCLTLSSGLPSWGSCGSGSSQWTTLGSDIYYNTGNVGIGATTAPAAKFQVTSSSDGLLSLVKGSPSQATNLSEWQDTSGNKLFTIDSIGNITQTGFGTERGFGFKRTGAVGTATDPQFQIGRIIAGGINVPEMRWMYSDSTTTEKSVMEIENTGTLATVKDNGCSPITNCWGSHYEGFLRGDSVPLFRLQSNWLEFGPGGSTATDIRFTRVGTNTLALYTNGSNKLTIDGAGAVTFPGATSANMVRPTVGTVRIGGELAGISTAGSAADEGFLRVSAGGGSAAGAKSFIDLSGYSNVADMNQNIAFGTSGSEKMRLLSSGNFGIGTTNPGQTLDVFGAIRLGANTNANNVLNTSAGSAPTGNLFWGSRTLVDSSNVGTYAISASANNTFTGDQTFSGAVYLPSTTTLAMTRPAVGTARISGEVAGTTAISTAADQGFLRLSAGGGSAAGAKSFIDLSGFSSVADLNENLVFGTAGSERMRLLNNGNFGIGTNNPGQTLDVFGAVRLGTNTNANNVLNTSAGSAPTGDLFWGSRTLADSSNIATYAVTAGANTTFSGTNTFSNALLLPGTTTLAMTRPVVGTSRIAGEIAGTAVAGSGADQGFLRLSAGGGSAAGAKSFIDLSGYSSVADLNENIIMGTNGTERLRITNTGSIAVNTTTTTNPLTIGTSGSDGNGAFLSAGGTWTNGSSRDLKTNFTTLDPNVILTKINELPITQWNYKIEDPSVMHIGPIAEDFYSLFGLAGTNKFISTIDPSGVALIGIQALSQRLTSVEGQLPQSLQTNSLQNQINSLTTQTASISSISVLSQKVSTLENEFNTLSLGSSQSLLGNTTATISGTLAVVGKTTLGDVGITGTMSAGLLVITGIDGSINTLSDNLHLQSNGLGGVTIGQNKLTIDKDGNLVSTGTITAKKYHVDDSDSASASIGESTIKADTSKLDIMTSAITSHSKVFITPKTLGSGTIYVTNQADHTSFTVQLDKSASSDTTFDWWIVN